jgi:hypothetical protein
MTAGPIFKICDSNSDFIKYMMPFDEGYEHLQHEYRKHATFIEHVGCAYFDADMSKQGRVVLYMDRPHKCTW